MADEQLRAYLRATALNVPQKRVSNDDLARTIATSDEWIMSHTGIRYRHLAEEGTAASDLALPACRAVLKKAGIDPAAIDLVLVATTTPDHPGFPSTACIIQDKLGLANAGAMDIGAACSGFIYALETAKNFILAQAARNVLVVCSEVMSSITDWSDRNTCVLLGDGAAAALVSLNEERTESEILFSRLGAEGDGAPYLIRKGGGSR
ncbi:MAG TPA: 3-oxoacyl-ACP synthase, partial [Spirochaetia bacterium]|nr:3-oxoacyl-ACP synthase [Spirochaetia bacterium]